MQRSRLHRHSDSIYWFRRASGRQARQTESIQYYVLLADPKRQKSREELRTELARHTHRRQQKGMTAYLAFDAMVLVLLGSQDGINHYSNDSLSRLIPKQIFVPHSKYFTQAPTILTPEALLAECDKNVPARMHAHFDLGIAALAKGPKYFDIADKHFNACIEDRYFQFYVYFLSKAILAHRDNWAAWLKN